MKTHPKAREDDPPPGEETVKPRNDSDVSISERNSKMTVTN
jgi:hypothetical protein